MADYACGLLPLLSVLLHICVLLHTSRALIKIAVVVKDKHENWNFTTSLIIYMC